jgi:hypothetical protein
MSKRAPLSFNTERLTPAQAAIVEPSASSAPANTRKKAKADSRPHRVNRAFIAAHVPTEALKQFKLLAVQRDMTTQDMLIEAMNDLFAKHGLSRIA